MRRHSWGIALLVGLLLGLPPARGQDSGDATTAAARELSRQVEFLQRTIAGTPGLGGKGLYQQADLVQIDLTYFRQQLRKKVGRESLYLAYAPVEAKLKALLGDLRASEKWAAGLGYVDRRVEAAQHDLHFALFGADTGADRQTEILYRQTLALLARTADLGSTIQYVFDEQDVLPTWKGRLKELRGTINDLQRLQQNKAPRADLKQQMIQVDKAWDRLVRMFKELPTQTYWLLQSDAAQTDAVLGRLDRIFELKGQRDSLPSGNCE